MDFLSEIIDAKRKRLQVARARLPLERIRDLAGRFRAGARPHRLTASLRDKSRPNIIAEFKRSSPSKGKINARANPATVAKIYESAGAAAVSVLTEEDYFDGSLEDLGQVREATTLPILRKDFIFDEYQVYESAAAHADALLLIAAALDDEKLARLRSLAEEDLGLDALVEVHTKDELERASVCGARLIGVNNRDLRTFNVSIATSESLIQSALSDAILVSESGLNPEAVRRLRRLGYSGFLIGEALMRADNPAQALSEFMQEPDGNSTKRVRVKICGITNIDDARAAIDAGADMLGFNFYSRSARHISPEAAAAIVRTLRSEADEGDPTAAMIGVFVDQEIDEVLRVAEDSHLSGIQLHGDETVEYCDQLKKLAGERFIIKAVAADAKFSVEALKAYPAAAIMLDASHPTLRGGTGRLADWSMARKAAQQLSRVFLAGGLSPENVSEAIATVRPFGVDACSSLESSPGRKNAARMKAFVRAVRNE